MAENDNPAVRLDISLVEARLLRLAVSKVLLGSLVDPQMLYMYEILFDELNGLLATYDYTQKPSTHTLQ